MAFPSPSPFPYTRKTYISRQQTNMAASRTATRPGDARSATLFLGRGPPNIHTVGLSIPPPKNTYGGGRTLPYPNLWPNADPLPWGSSGAIAHPQPWGRSGAIAHPNLREAVEP